MKQIKQENLVTQNRAKLCLKKRTKAKPQFNTNQNRKEDPGPSKTIPQLKIGTKELRLKQINKNNTADVYDRESMKTNQEIS